MDIILLQKKIKRAEFKRNTRDFFKGLSLGMVVLWSFWTFYHLYGDTSWKEHIDQFRMLMFKIDLKLSGIFKI
jgi:hypothetical protein